MSTNENVLATSSTPPKYGCAWKDCKGDPHPSKVDYKDQEQGCTERGTYVGNWPEPFHILTPSYTNFGVQEGCFKGLCSRRYVGVVQSNRDHYETQNHHVIPVASIQSFTRLTHNLKLIGWNLNDGISNGICLPYFREDSIWHDLQPHRGSHPRIYTDDVKESLKPLETECLVYCQEAEKEDSKVDQQTLKKDINKLVETIRNRILNWRIFVHLPETLNKWENQVATRIAKKSIIGLYYKSPDGEPSVPPTPDKGKRGSRKYIE